MFDVVLVIFLTKQVSEIIFLQLHRLKRLLTPVVVKTFSMQVDNKSGAFSYIAASHILNYIFLAFTVAPPKNKKKHIVICKLLIKPIYFKNRCEPSASNNRISMTTQVFSYI